MLLPLVVDYANGLTQIEIAKKHGIHVQTLRKRLQAAGVNTRARGIALSDADVRSAQAAIADGASIRATARRLGFAHTTLQRTLRSGDVQSDSPLRTTAIAVLNAYRLSESPSCTT